MSRRRGGPRLWGLGLFVVVAGVDLDSKVATSFDSKWSLHQALSLLREGDLDLDEYRAVIAVRHRRSLPGWLALAGPVLLPFALWSRATYGTLLPPYYGAERLALHPGLGEALAAHLVSPARGLLVYSPWLAAAAVGPFVAPGGRRRPDAVGVGCLVTSALVWLAASAFGHWWGGHCYGPRLLADAVPYLVVLAMPVVPAVWPRRGGGGSMGRRPRHPLAAVALAAALAWSVFVHGHAARSWGPWTWNGEPVDVDRHPERVWDWSDPPFLRFEHPSRPR